MSLFYLVFDWFARYSAWTALAAFVVVTTLAVTWYFERK